MTRSVPAGVGIAGPSLAPAERALLTRWSPWAVILFRRNLKSVEELACLVSELRALARPPLLCVDQEGGTVDRFRELLTPSISFRDAARAGLARRAGEMAGEACARLGFDIDLAPVVDRLVPGASEDVLRNRCASADPEEVSRAALDFLGGLHARGIGGCIKHFPGLGRATLDTHRQLPRIPSDREEEARDLAPFRATMEASGAVMISHAAGPGGRPASLSSDVASGLLRGRLGFSGAAFSDDLEMGALSELGSLPERCVSAISAGCDLVFVCSRVEEYEDCFEALERKVAPERLAEARARLEIYARRLAGLRAGAEVPDRRMSALVADIEELREQA